MPSPFPGMNPYLERQTAWDSFHPHFLAGCLDHIAGQLGPEYIIRIETRLYIHEPPADRRFLGASDLGMSAPPRAGEGTRTLTAPQYTNVLDAVDIQKVGFLTIRDRDGNDLVTALELLSRANKYAGDDRIQYLGKRNELLRSRANFVEIDLLRGGPRMPPDDLPAGDYCAIVSRPDDRPRAGVWAWRLREPMTPIPVPLRPDEEHASLDLKAVLDPVYDRGRYANYIYTGRPEPRLTPDDAAWAAQFVPPGTPTS